MNTYDIIPLKVGEFQLSEKSNFTFMKNQGKKIKAPIIMYLVQNREAKFLVDVGCADEDWCRKYHHPIVQTKDMQPLNALADIHVYPKDVDFIILTHLHWDHCFNLNLFDKTKIFVQKKEVINALFPQKTQIVFYEGYEMGLTPPWVKYLQNMIFLDGDSEIIDGIRVVFLPGHTKGFQGVEVNTKGGKFLIAGDTIPLFENMEDELFGMIRPSGIHVDLEEYYKTLELIKQMGLVVLPGHDERVFAQKKYPAI